MTESWKELSGQFLSLYKGVKEVVDNYSQTLSNLYQELKSRVDQLTSRADAVDEEIALLKAFGASDSSTYKVLPSVTFVGHASSGYWNAKGNQSGPNSCNDTPVIVTCGITTDGGYSLAVHVEYAEQANWGSNDIRGICFRGGNSVLTMINQYVKQLGFTLTGSTYDYSGRIWNWQSYEAACNVGECYTAYSRGQLTELNMHCAVGSGYMGHTSNSGASAYVKLSLAKA